MNAFGGEVLGALPEGHIADQTLEGLFQLRVVGVRVGVMETKSAFPFGRARRKALCKVLPAFVKGVHQQALTPVVDMVYVVPTVAFSPPGWWAKDDFRKQKNALEGFP